MRWFTILLYLSMALQTTLSMHADDDEDESIDDAKNEKLDGADCRNPKPGPTFEFIEDCIIEDTEDHEQVEIVVLQERDFEDVPGLSCRMYRSAITEECWQG